MSLAALLGSAIFFSYGGCLSLAPTPTKRSGYEQCGDVGALYCNSYSTPQTLNDRVPGTCCAANYSVGYLCAWGVNQFTAGCYDNLSQAHNACDGWLSTNPTIVRCTN